MKRIAILGALLLGVGLAVPVDSTTVPPWRYRVVDRSGVPIPNAFTRQHWQDYSLEGEGHEQDARTDGEGWVSFPERKAKAGRWRRLFGTITNAVWLGVHASYSPHAHVLALHDGYEGWLDYHAGQPQPDRLVLSHAQ